MPFPKSRETAEAVAIFYRTKATLGGGLSTLAIIPVKERGLMIIDTVLNWYAEAYAFARDRLIGANMPIIKTERFMK